MSKLIVGIDHIAALREFSKSPEPDPVYACVLAELAGADGISVHLREDRKTINDRDVRLLKEIIKTKFYLKTSVTQEMRNVTLELKPDIVTFVPERRDDSLNGLEITLNQEILGNYIKLIHEANIRVCVFINPDIDQLKAAYKIGVDLIEINTSKYAVSFLKGKYKKELEDVSNIAKYAVKLNIDVAAGSGITHTNIIPLLEIKEINEFCVDHSLVARATLVGVERAVREFKEIIR